MQKKLPIKKNEGIRPYLFGHEFNKRHITNLQY